MLTWGNVVFRGCGAPRVAGQPQVVEPHLELVLVRWCAGVVFAEHPFGLRHRVGPVAAQGDRRSRGRRGVELRVALYDEPGGQFGTGVAERLDRVVERHPRPVSVAARTPARTASRSTSSPPAEDVGQGADLVGVRQ